MSYLKKEKGGTIVVNNLVITLTPQNHVIALSRFVNRHVSAFLTLPNHLGNPYQHHNKMAPEETSSAVEQPVIFRPGKKRKAYRQRAVDQTTTASDLEHTGDHAGVVEQDGDNSENGGLASGDEGLSVAEVMRLRNARRARLGGVGFSARPGPHRDDGPAATPTDQSLVPT